MRYDLGRVYVRSIDTHDDYDRRNLARARKK
jgi:mRNA-degrading endonuclease HigB of HigAB toxin-antitoxin module